jgi:hypothetical protein
LEEAENLKSKILSEEVKYIETSKKIVDSKETKEMILKSLLEMYNSLKVKLSIAKHHIQKTYTP